MILNTLRPRQNGRQRWLVYWCIYVSLGLNGLTSADSRRGTVQDKLYYMEAKTKWPAFCRWNFQTNLLEWMLVYFFHSNLPDEPWYLFSYIHLAHWGRVTHICVSKLTIIDSDNGLSPCRRQAITWTNVGILLTGPPGTNSNEILIESHTFSFKENPFQIVVWKLAAILSRPQCVHTILAMVQIMAWCWPAKIHPDSKVHGANMGPTWVLSAPDGPHVGPMNLAIGAILRANTGLVYWSIYMPLYLNYIYQCQWMM